MHLLHSGRAIGVDGSYQPALSRSMRQAEITCIQCALYLDQELSNLTRIS